MVPSDPIEKSGQTKYLKARLRNAPLQGYDLNGDRQALTEDTIVITAEAHMAPYPLPYAGKKLDNYLQPSALVQSDDAKIREQTAKILAMEKDAAAQRGS